MATNVKAEGRAGIDAKDALTGILALLIDERDSRVQNDKDARGPKSYLPRRASESTTSRQ